MKSQGRYWGTSSPSSEMLWKQMGDRARGNSLFRGPRPGPGPWQCFSLNSQDKKKFVKLKPPIWRLGSDR